ncbi:MAG: sigma-54 dependent transcriptional regulator [Pseudomonadota bacterium]
MSSLPTLLVVSNDAAARDSLQELLSDEFDVNVASTPEEAETILQSEWVQIILCDQRMPEQSGVEFLESMRALWPEVIRMIIAVNPDHEEVLSAINGAGVYQLVTKPWDEIELRLSLSNAAELFRLNRKNELLSLELKSAPARATETAAQRSVEHRCDDGIVRSVDSPMNAICDKLKQVAPFDISVLLTGESGTGKELAARALHQNSLRWEKPFVVENCGALPDELLESELFGYKRGAFTGAIEDRAGLFERANGGTVFLDEVGEISPAFQVKLLRVLQDGEVRPLGSGQTRRVDVRVIAATNRDLEADVAAGRFREDLYYRLAAVTVHLPPVRERLIDLPMLSQALLVQASRRFGKPAEQFTKETLACMADYPWPGNVRELRNEIERMLVESNDAVLGANLLSPRVLAANPEVNDPDIAMINRPDLSLKARVEIIEASILKESLVRHGWNKTQTARELGLSRVGLRSKLERYGLGKFEALHSMTAKGATG